MPVGSARAARRGRLPVAIPDSVIAQLNARTLSLSDGESVSTWPAEVGPDATGSGTYRTEAVNNYPAVEVDPSSNNGYDLSIGTYSEPITWFVVAEAGFADTNDNFPFLVGTNTSGTTALLWAGNDLNWRITGDSGSINGTNDVTIQLFTGVWDGSNDEFRENAASQGITEIGQDDHTDLSFGRDIDGENTFDGWLGFLEVHNGLPSNGLMTREEEIADMWDIAI